MRPVCGQKNCQSQRSQQGRCISISVADRILVIHKGRAATGLVEQRSAIRGRLVGDQSSIIYLCNLVATSLQLVFLLASLNQRLRGSLYDGTSPSSVRSPFSNNFFSETAGPISIRFHVHLPNNGGTKVCSTGLGHITKMAAMPKYGKNLKKILFSRTTGPIALKLGMDYQVCINDDTALTLTSFTARSSLVL